MLAYPFLGLLVRPCLCVTMGKPWFLSVPPSTHPSRGVIVPTHLSQRTGWKLTGDYSDGNGREVSPPSWGVPVLPSPPEIEGISGLCGHMAVLPCVYRPCHLPPGTHARPCGSHQRAADVPCGPHGRWGENLWEGEGNNVHPHPQRFLASCLRIPWGRGKK